MAPDRADEEPATVQADLALHFRQIARTPVATGSPQAFIASVVGLSSELGAAIHSVATGTSEEELGSVSMSTFKDADERKSEFEGLPHFHCFTGQSDPVFVEARLVAGKFALVLEITVLNTTARILQDTTLELYAIGEAKVAERIHGQTLGPGESYLRRVSVKVERAEKLTVYGFVTYSGTRGEPQSVLVLNDLMLNLAERLGVLKGEGLPPQQFKEKWQLYTWEKKQTLERAAPAPPMKQFVESVAEGMGLAVVETQGAGAFLVANLFGKSPYDDDCLLNMSLRAEEGGGVKGQVRVRSNKQALCESIAEKIRQFAAN